MKKLMRRLAAAAVGVTLALGLVAGSLAAPAGASTNHGGSITYWCGPLLGVSDNANISQGGFLGWAVDLDVSAYHATSSGASCGAPISFWSAVSITTEFTVERWTFGGWVTCYWSAQSGYGDVYKAANSTQGNQSSVCTSTTWPDGFTVIQWQETAYVNGVGYTWGINAYTTVAA